MIRMRDESRSFICIFNFSADFIRAQATSGGKVHIPLLASRSRNVYLQRKKTLQTAFQFMLKIKRKKKQTKRNVLSVTRTRPHFVVIADGTRRTSDGNFFHFKTLRAAFRWSRVVRPRNVVCRRVT